MLTGPPFPRPPASADPMAPVDHAPPLPPGAAADPMAPVDPSNAQSPGAGIEADQAMSSRESPATEVSDQLATARIIARKRAEQRQRSQRTLIATMLVLLLVVGALGIGYATGLVRFGKDNLLTKQDDREAAVTDNRRPGSANESDGSEPAGGASDASRPAAEPFPAIPPSPVDPPVEVDTKPQPPPDPAQVERFETALRDARKALGERQYQQAKEDIAAARKTAVSAEQKHLVQGFQALAQYVEDFWQAVGQGLKQLETAGELKIGNTIVSVVEVGPKHLLIREAGENRRYSVDALPARLAVAIAWHWFDDRAANKLCVGAYHFVGPPVDLEEARRLWEQAAGEGIDAADLLALVRFASRAD